MQGSKINFALQFMCTTLQVRKPLYKSAIGRWRGYEEQLRLAQDFLTPTIKDYEQMLQKVGLGGPQDTRTEL